MNTSKIFIKHQYYTASRSKNFASNMGINIFLGIMFGLLALQIFFAGIFFHEILKDIAPDKNPITLINSSILIYVIFDLKLRFFLQKIHGIAVVPYLHLPIKKKSLVHHLILRSFVSLFNITPLLLLIPISVNIIGFEYDWLTSFLWVMFILFYLQTASLLNIYINRISFRNSKVALVYVVLLIVVLLTYYFDLFNIGSFSNIIFGAVLKNNLLIIIPIISVSAFYYLNYNFMRRHLYLEDLEIGKKGNHKSGNISWLKNFGEIGSYISLEIKMILRNKRPRSTMIFSFFFLLFGFLAYGVETYSKHEFFHFYFGMLLTGMVMMTYGQFLLCWESSYFDFILSKKISLYEYLKAKYYLMIIGSTAAFILLIPFALFNIEILYKNLILWIYNMGVNSFVMFILSSFSRKPVDLNVSVMNQQGKGASQYMTILPTLFIPIVIYLPIEAIWGSVSGYIVIGGLGIIGLVFHSKFLGLVVNLMNKQKYKMAEAFRA